MSAPPPLCREYAVRLSCGRCESGVEEALRALPLVTSVSASAADGTVVVEGDAPPAQVLAALAASGREARLVGGGAASAVPAHAGPAGENAACVAEFKGAAHGTGSVVGLLRIFQLDADTARVELDVCGLPADSPFCVAVHARGDLSRGAASAGPPARPLLAGRADADGCGRLWADAAALRVWEVVGRAAVVHGGAEKPPAEAGAAAAAAVLARSAAVGANPKRVCACDGTVLWDADALSGARKRQ